MARFRNVFAEFVEHANKDRSKLARRVRKVIDRDLFCGVFSDGEGHGYVETSALYHVPDYAHDYALRFAEGLR